MRAARIQHETTVAAVLDGPARQFQLSSVPKGDLTGAELVVLSGAAAGKKVSLGVFTGNTVRFGVDANIDIANTIAAGDRVRIDNLDALALQTYHRHQVPEVGIVGWEQYREPDGKPIPPQRSALFTPLFSRDITGRFNGKMIMVQGLMDVNAFPANPEWYKNQAHKAFGREFDDKFRIYYIDHAQHGGEPVGLPANARTISYRGALHQALGDLSAWVERGVKPLDSTSYKLLDSQVVVPEHAAERKGIQPVVELKANGGERADVAVGQPVTFTAAIQVPPRGGKVVAAQWDFEGVGNYPVDAQIRKAEPTVKLTATYSFSKPGIYFPVLRAASQREGDMNTPFARIQNIDRVRVVVTADFPGPAIRDSVDPARASAP